MCMRNDLMSLYHIILVTSYLKSDPVGVNDSNVHVIIHVIIHVMYMNKELRWNRIPPCPVETYY